jgi:7-cyano-7-deazaguanine synthase
MQVGMLTAAQYEPKLRAVEPAPLPVVVLLSGGLDSAALVRYVLDGGHAVQTLHLQYGQAAAAREAAAASSVAAHFNVPLSTVRLVGLPATSAGYIRGRNAALLTVALSWNQHSPSLVAIGVHAGTSYADALHRCHAAGFRRVRRRRRPSQRSVRALDEG